MIRSDYTAQDLYRSHLYTPQPNRYWPIAQYAQTLSTILSCVYLQFLIVVYGLSF